MQEFQNVQLWAHRGYLPHYNADFKYQMITYRLADSLPQKVLSKLSNELQEIDDLERRKFIEDYLDRGYGSCILANPEVAKTIIENWLHFDKKRYDLVSYVIMPNHVHILIKVYEISIGKIVHGWKSYTSNKIQEILGAGWKPAVPGKVWQTEYWDRFIRDLNHFNKSIEYIHNNPVKAGLVSHANDWKWSTAKEEQEEC